MKYQVIKLVVPNIRGLKLATEIYRPEGSGKMSAVLLFHGFTGYKEGADLVDIAHKLAESGIVSVRYNASGLWDSEGSMENDYRFSNHRDDAESVLHYISNLSYVDPSRVGVYGHSMGGKLAVFFCADHPDIRALCIGSAPVTFMSTSYVSVLPEWKKEGYFQKVSGRDGGKIRVPYEYVVDAEKYDVVKAAGQVIRPQSLVIAGKLDTEVPWQETKKIFEVLQSPKEFLLIDELSHKYGRTPNLFPIVHEPIVKFFVRALQ